MQYLGGKARLAVEIGTVVRERAAGRAVYVEPFVGGGFSFAATAGAFDYALASDASPDLMLLWLAVKDGWTPPGAVSEEEYRALRHAEPSALRTFVGFGCSFGGKWFGGYARNARGDDFCSQAARGIERKRAAFERAALACCLFQFNLEEK